MLADRDKIQSDDHVLIFLSTYNDGRQALVFGVNPLGACFEPFIYTDIGRRNMDAFVQSGFDVVKFAPNGGAVPGDRIVGILTPGEGITIYPIQSPTLKECEDTPERWLDVRWDMDEREPQRFPESKPVENLTVQLMLWWEF